MTYVWSTRHIYRNSEIVGADCNLAGSHLIEDVAVYADCVCSACKYINPFLCHYKGWHVVCNESSVKAHFSAYSGSESGSLEIGPGLRAEEPDVISSLPALKKHHAQYCLSVALGHYSSVLRKLFHKELCCVPDPIVAAVIHFDYMVPNCFVCPSSFFQSLKGHRNAAFCQHSHTLRSSGTGG